MDLLPFALALHALAAVVWVGGMAFAYWFVRPVAGQALEASARLALWSGVFARFFPVVWISIGILLATGYYMVLGPLGGFAAVGLHIHAMHGLALLMTALFLHLFFAPWRRFRRAVTRMENDQAAVELGRIRWLVAINLALGIIIVLVATAGRYWTF
ncbi:MAG: CopD family protein [Halofilum sp. (in: g-proteobacteria)]